MNEEEFKKKLSGQISQDEKDYILNAFKLVSMLPDKKINEKIGTINVLSSLQADKNSMAASMLSLLPQSHQKELEKFEKETVQILESQKKFSSVLDKYREMYSTHPELKKVLYFSLTKNPKLLLLEIAEAFGKLKKIKKIPKDEADAIAKEMVGIFIPLIHKLGINKIKSSAEDIVFLYLEPKTYTQFFGKIMEKRKKIWAEIGKMKKAIAQKAAEEKIPVQIQYRAKGIFSTYRKMQTTDKELEDIHDIFAIRVIVHTIEECYEMLGIIHSLWLPLQEEFDDYIIKPKNNNYRSLHTTVLARENFPVEIQIRTKEMHNETELGAVAAHWKYKGEEEQKAFDKRIAWLNEFISWQLSKKKAQDIKINFYANKTYAFTPKGEIIEMPEEATLLDFAFLVHSDLGTHCIGGIVNGKKSPIDRKIENFDVVEITTSQKQLPKIQWLKIVKTEKARSKIKQALDLKFPTKKQKTFFHKETLKTSDKRIRIAKCCHPLAGDEVVGFRTTKRKITIHRINCPEIKKFSSQKPLSINWEIKKGTKMSTEIKVIALDRPALLKDLLDKISEKTKIINATIRQLGRTNSLCVFEINAKSTQETEALMETLRLISGVKKVTRA